MESFLGGMLQNKKRGDKKMNKEEEFMEYLITKYNLPYTVEEMSNVMRGD